VSAQSDCDIQMTSPISYTTKLSGSFGEPRTRHFHAGIDYKQKRGVPFDTIYSIAEGFVSRISVSPDGYGQALYIDHPCNKTSVYAHLHEFAPTIQAYIDSILYARLTYSAVVYPLEHGDSIRVKAGEPIGIMGNTGRSSGAHLHFEVRETSSDTPINPVLLGFKPKDDIPPDVVGVFIYEFTPDNEEVSRKYYPASKNKSGFYTIGNTPIMTGAHKIGIGLRTYDRMNGASNHNGIYSLVMYVDGTTQFGFKMDSIPFAKAKYIHTHMDYREKVAKRYVTQCFMSPINELDIYGDATTGYISPYSYRDTDVKIMAADVEGNRSIIQLALRRDDTKRYDIGVIDTTKVRVTPFEASTLSNEGTSVTFSDSTFSQPIRLRLGAYDPLSIDLRQEVDIPTFRRYRISHQCKSTGQQRERYALTSINDKGKQVRHKIRWSNDSTVVSFLSALKKYELVLDSIAPTIAVLKVPGVSSDRFSTKITDNLIPEHDSEALDIKVLLNDKWVLCQQDAKTDQLWFDMPVSRTGEMHKVIVQVQDASGNQQELTRSFSY